MWGLSSKVLLLVYLLQLESFSSLLLFLSLWTWFIFPSICSLVSLGVGSNVSPVHWSAYFPAFVTFSTFFRMLPQVPTPDNFKAPLYRLRSDILGWERRMISKHSSKYPSAIVFTTVCNQLFKDTEKQKSYAALDDARLEVSCCCSSF